MYPFGGATGGSSGVSGSYNNDGSTGMTWWESIKKEFNSNTIENPLNDLFKVPKEKRVPVVPSPLKEKAKSSIGDITSPIVDAVKDIKAKTTPIVFFGAIALIVYALSSKK